MRRCDATALTLLIALAVAGVPVTRVPGDDDVVAEAAAVPDGMNPMHQRVSLEQQFDGMVGGIGGGWVEGPRRDAGDTFLAALSLELSALDAVVGLSDAQRVRCERAARIEAGRARDDIDALRRSCAGRFVDFQTPEGQAEWQRFFGEFQRLQATISAPRETPSLLSRTIRGVLDDRQRGLWEEERNLRDRARWQRFVDSGLAELETLVALNGAQHEALTAMLLEKPIRIHPGRLRSWFGDDSTPIPCWVGLARLDRDRLKAVFSERQWTRLEALLQQGEAWKQQFLSQKVFEE